MVHGTERQDREKKHTAIEVSAIRNARNTIAKDPEHSQTTYNQ